jgi:alkanesulfonate monooxygenase SsuD/methylene tetrahydromethanopterin reductase-like flavin-dependent oxidoreductase (luciferase family)
MLAHGGEVAGAVAAEDGGLTFVHVAARPGTETAIAATVAAATDRVRIGLHVGDEHPVTLAEEVAVLDNLSNGRIVVIAELEDLAPDDAIEDVALLRGSWSGRPISHRGRRWRVPAGLPGHVAPPAVMVTPPPAQLEIPLWVSGAAAIEVSRALSLPCVAATPAAVDASQPVAPGRGTLGGDLDVDRQVVIDWSAAGATHLVCAMTGTASLEELTRWLVPEVAMVSFPRVVAESPPPAPWPGSR